MTIADSKQRLQALNPEQSFIVQAPAGSGKTELLTQRFLVLLANAQKNPEEIVAITFTRKAAAEMRHRILENLLKAQTQPEPTTDHEQLTWRLAQQALANDHHLQWNLLSNPNRLRILTIDSLCAKITQQMPYLSQLGSQPNISDDPENLYQQTIENLFSHLGQADQWDFILQNLLIHLDNRSERLQQLLINLLTTREQWIGFIGIDQNKEHLKQKLQQSLQYIAQDALDYLRLQLKPEWQSTLISLIEYANQQLEQPDLNNLSSINFKIKSLTQWQVIANWLLTDNDQFRKSFNINQGFPAPTSFKDKEKKSQAQLHKQQIQALSQQFSDELRQALIQIRNCPAIEYSDNQWQLIQNLIALLPLLLAHLKLVFKKQNQVDFTEISLRALQALGDDDNPSELALKLDYQIQHLLVDEFQDTSVLQFKLLENLTQGWIDDGSKTLFLVGDPMQSIYRFRQAEVGLFLKAKQSGIGNLSLQSLTLSSNFRSQKNIIHWINESFSQIFPSKNNMSTGAICYENSIANRDAHDNSVFYYSHGDSVSEAQHICRLIQSTLQQQPNLTIAILVKARNHLSDIIAQLHHHNISFSAHDIHRLFSKTFIQQLMSLTFALLHPAQKLHWLAILRAPWCGMSLTDLAIISEHGDEICLWENLQKTDLLSKLSHHGQQAITRFCHVIHQAFEQRQRLPLDQWIKTTWYGLSGPSLLDDNDLNDSENYFNLLSQYDFSTLYNFSDFQNRLTKLYAQSQQVSQVQLLTIHKAKGLEFDLVIMPSLNKQGSQDDQQIILWEERVRAQQTDLIMAPIKASHDKQDNIYQWVQAQENIKAQHEMARLFYVATTRAKQQLHLYAQINLDDEDIKSPSKRSFLGLLWPLYQQNFINNKQDTVTQATLQKQQTLKLIKRVQPDFSIKLHSEPQTENPITPFEWQYQQHNKLGTLIHLILQHMVDNQITQWNSKHPWSSLALQHGITREELPQAIATINTVINHITNHPQGQFILAEYPVSKTEMAIDVMNHGVVKKYIIDRFFICDDVAWIVDYKITQPNKEQSFAEFIQQQKQQYQAQLNNYQQAMTMLIDNPITTALYFPLIPHLEIVSRNNKEH